MILKGFPANGFPKKKERVLKKEPVFTRLGSTKWQKISKYGNKSQKEEINPMKKGQMPFKCGKSA